MSLPIKIPALAVALGLATVSSVFAQVPTRPGLPLAAQPAPTPPTTNLVQRQFDPNTGQPLAPQQVPFGSQAPAGGDFFFVDENSTAPADFAGDLSDYNSEVMRQAGNQLQGDYGSIAHSSMPSGQTQEAWNRPFDNMSAGQSAPGVVRYQWSADLVMPVRLRAGMVTNIILPDWDAAEDVVIGDGGTVEATILRTNVIGVKSVQTGSDTSLGVIGASGNVYTFYLRTEGRNTRVVTDMQVFVQAGPSKSSAEWFNSERRDILGDGDGKAVPAARNASITLPGSASNGDEPVPEDKRIFNLKMFEVNDGDRIIAPEYAYTDGRFTYLHYAAGVTDRPAVFRAVDGVEGRVNTRVMGRHSEIIVVEALGDFVLRSGTRTVCIVTDSDADGRPEVEG